VERGNFTLDSLTLDRTDRGEDAERSRILYGPPRISRSTHQK
jgi:hypothetical protein